MGLRRLRFAAWALVAGCAVRPSLASAQGVDRSLRVVVNKENKLASLTTDDLTRIFLGKKTLWDSGTRWDQIETKQGKYHWASLDRAVSAAEAAGAKEILYVLGSTPSWAASAFSGTDLYGPGTASFPKKTKHYHACTKAVAPRKKGRTPATHPEAGHAQKEHRRPDCHSNRHEPGRDPCPATGGDGHRERHHDREPQQGQVRQPRFGVARATQPAELEAPGQTGSHSCQRGRHRAGSSHEGPRAHRILATSHVPLAAGDQRNSPRADGIPRP